MTSALTQLAGLSIEINGAIPSAYNHRSAGLFPRGRVRADAQRNRERLLDVAVGLILKVGGEPTTTGSRQRRGWGWDGVSALPGPSDAAPRGGAAVLEATIEAGEGICRRDVDSLDAVRQYVHAAIDHGIGVVNMIHPLLEDADWPDLSPRAGGCWTTRSNAADKDQRLRCDLSVDDIVYPRSDSAGRSRSGCLSQRPGHRPPPTRPIHRRPPRPRPTTQ